jgi:sugar lactone lactonase YvrE
VTAAKAASAESFQLAEGPDWDAARAAQERLVLVHPHGTRQDGSRIVPIGAHRRCNDGSTDPAGRFLVGTLSLEHDSSVTEVLVRLEQDGSITELDTDLTLSNGLAWSADGSRMFNVDTIRRTVYVRDYDAWSGAIGARRLHLRLAGGRPDGIAMDVEDHLWIAVWGRGEVRRYDPDGSEVDRLTVPAPHTSCVMFAGPDLGVVVISTATQDRSDQQLRDHPESGYLFTASVGVRGVPVPPWTPTDPFPAD